LDSVGVAAGKSRITVWSISTGCSPSRLFVPWSPHGSAAGVERRLKKLGNLAPSTRIGIASSRMPF